MTNYIRILSGASSVRHLMGDEGVRFFLPVGFHQLVIAHNITWVPVSNNASFIH